jgi:hypothetical protein
MKLMKKNIFLFDKNMVKKVPVQEVILRRLNIDLKYIQSNT